MSEEQLSSEERSTIVFYGAGWCPSVRMTRAWLDRHGVAYDYRDIDHDEGAMDGLLALRGKAWVVPTLVLLDGTILDDPPRRDLKKLLGL
jgi:mycoredoxin